MPEPGSKPRLPGTYGWRCCRWMPMLVLMIVGSLGPGCAVAVDSQAIADAQTAARVKTVLVNDPDLGARPIEVRVSRGVVHLTGRVLSEDEVTRALTLARRVSGVQDVQSRLQIGTEPPPEVGPPQAGRGPALDQELLDLQAPPTLLAVGLSLSRTLPREDALNPRIALGPTVKIGSGRGIGTVIGFNWFHADFVGTTGGGQSVSRINVKPFMVGVGYTMGPDHVSITTSLVAGVAFNSLSIREPAAGPLAVDVGNSFVWRPSVTVWRNLTRRTVLNITAGYIGTRLRVTFLDDDAIDVRRLSGSTAVVSTGVAYRIF